MAIFGTVNAEYLVSQVGAVSESDTRNLFDALAADHEASVKVLRAEAVTSANEKNWRRKSQLAILALHLGHPEIATDMCQFENRPDPVQRTMFIDEFPIWDVGITELVQLVESNNDLGLRSAVLLGVGSIPDNRLRTEEKGAWQALAANWYVSQRDRSTHSAAGLLLRRWNIPLPEVSADNGQTLPGDWYINSQVQTLLLMAAGSFHQFAESNEEHQDHDVVITESFWLSDREVSVGQFQRFMEDSEYPPSDKPAGSPWAVRHVSMTPNHPVTNVSWHDTRLYCNWLSVQEGLSPAYERTGASERSGQDEFDAWHLVKRSSGYRLPHEDEWEYACRAGTTTAWASGDDEELLRGYAQHDTSLVGQCGVKLPNAWGLWDMHGNVCEWCDNGYNPIKNARFLRGGSIGYRISYARSASRAHLPPVSRSGLCGFRIARTSQPDSLAAFLPSEGEPTFETPKAVPQSIVQPAVLKSRPLIEAGLGLTSVQYSSDSSLVLLGGFDRMAALLDLKTKNEIQVFRGHENVVWSVALSPDGRTAVMGSEDKTLRLWDVAAGKELDQFTAGNSFSCVRYSKDGKSVFATNWDGKVRVWTPSENRFNTPTEFKFPLPTLGLALLPDETKFVIGTPPWQVLLCDAQNGDVRMRFDGHSGLVHSVAVVDSGNEILSASHDSMKCSPDPGPADMLHFSSDRGDRTAIRMSEVEGMTNDAEARSTKCGIQGESGISGCYGASDRG